MSRKWPYIVCPHCSTGYSRMEAVTKRRQTGQDEFPCVACGKEISSHDPGILPQKGAAYKRPPDLKL